MTTQTTTQESPNGYGPSAGLSIDYRGPVIIQRDNGDYPDEIIGYWEYRDGEHWMKVKGSNSGVELSRLRLPENDTPTFEQIKTIYTWQVSHETVLEKASRDEWGDAELFAALFRGLVLYDVDEKKWYLWNGGYWAEDKSGQVWNLVGNQLSGRYEQAAGYERSLSNGDDVHSLLADTLNKRAHDLRTHKYATGIVDYIQKQPALVASNSIWDANPMLLGCQNGVIDLRTGKLRPGRPKDFIRTIIPTSFEGLNTPAPRFERFLSEIFDNDSELVRFTQRLFGYGLTGSSNEAVIPFLVGAGRNGKDSLMQAFENTLGLGISGPVSSSILLGGRSNPDAATPYVYNLRFKRIAYINETNDGAALNAGQVKWLTGASTLTGRLLHGNPVTFKPQHLLILLTT